MTDDGRRHARRRRRVLQGSLALGTLVILVGAFEALDGESEAAEAPATTVSLLDDEPLAIKHTFVPPPLVIRSDARAVRETEAVDTRRSAPPPPPSSRIIRRFPTTSSLAPPTRAPATALNLPWSIPSVRAPLSDPPSRKDRPPRTPPGTRHAKEAALPPRDDAPRHVSSGRK